MQKVADRHGWNECRITNASSAKLHRRRSGDSVKSFCLKSASNATCFSINTYMAQPDKHMFNGSIRCCTTLLWVEHDFAPKTILV